MEKSRKIIFGTLLTTAVAITAIALSTINMTNQKVINARSLDHVCSGNHYTGKCWDDFNGSKAKGLNGYYEYWHCCTCDAHYFRTKDIENYNPINWTDNGEVNQYAPKNSSDENYYTDDRVRFGGGHNDEDLQLHFVNKLDSGKSITVDGERDSYYDTAEKYSFSTKYSEDKGTDVTATIETLWQNTTLYIYMEVNDSTKCTRDFTTPSAWSYDNNDCVELRIDTLHSEKLAKDDWDGKMGANYRKDFYENGLACEGIFQVAAGYSLSERYNNQYGCVFSDFGWMSNKCHSEADNTTQIKSKYLSDSKYSVEYAIDFINNYNKTSDVNPFGEIGLAIKIFDQQKNDDGTFSRKGIINFEQIGDASDYPRNFSNFRLVGWGE